MKKEYTYNTFDNSKGFNHFSGYVKGGKEITILDVYEIDEQPTTPKGINKYLFNIMKTATSEESDIFKNLI